MAPEKLVSLEREKGEEPKPLKSILKVGSNLTGKSVSFTIPPIDAKMDEAQRWAEAMHLGLLVASGLLLCAATTRSKKIVVEFNYDLFQLVWPVDL